MSGSALTEQPQQAPRRVRHDFRDNLLVMAVTVGASVLLTTLLILLTRIGR